MERQRKSAVVFAILYSVMFWGRLGDWLLPATLKAPIKFVFYTALCILGIYAYWDKLTEKYSWLKKHPLKALGILLLGYLLMVIVHHLFDFIEGGVRQLFHIQQELTNDTGIYAVVKQYPAYLILSVMGVFGPLVEELFYRQFLLDTLLNYLPKSLAIIISSVLFAVLHVHQFQLSEFVGVLGHFGFGLVFALVYLKTDKNIAFPISLHVLNNVMGLLTLLQNL
ncbi:CPBP family intramembrane metalloprotease [Streptococcus sp. zg-86]|uniref:CPBP family intramembrane metalloprotease n=1 Tax=Streptococcus zhangguiae TaxID=2664091 RepID=A0A6I4RCR1_9STRE|nr:MULTISPECIES: CPBP family intramembrane glutamic endopeptidase [unclassified Streptococcus]MTB63472.1 CPBP family intramembrane metalloprotease [Streptococcus sp. zg-86]MTB89879.1 CPBP family intramembrane metalloprotease [Streptococcus sp. zg-36]MWV55550.1 CPBP family intramembrane metalloprotease [Streptococcus sp. zg-70]QTH47740.1 CPBP family intramembrane metalloprotease [Streptococcus sp. zg-86]